MGMSIDEAINHGQEQLEIFGGEHREFIETAIDTMRKYQRVQEIIKSEMSYVSPNMNPNNLSGLARALEIFREVEVELI